MRVDPKIAPTIPLHLRVCRCYIQKGNLAGALTAKAKLNRLAFEEKPKTSSTEATEKKPLNRRLHNIAILARTLETIKPSHVAA